MTSLHDVSDSETIHHPTIATIIDAIKKNDTEYLSKHRGIIGVYFRLGKINQSNMHHFCGKPSFISTKIDDEVNKFIRNNNTVSSILSLDDYHNDDNTNEHNDEDDEDDNDDYNDDDEDDEDDDEDDDDDGCDRHGCDRHGCDWETVVNIVDYFTFQLIGEEGDDNYIKSKNIWESCKFMIIEGIIDPNYIFNHKIYLHEPSCKHILLTFAIKDCDNWVLEKERLFFLLEHTDKELIRTFKNYDGGSIMNYISDHLHPDVEIELIGKLIDYGVSIDHIVVTPDFQESFLSKMISLDNLKYIEYALKSGQDPNFMTSIINMTEENIDVCDTMNFIQNELYCHRKTKNIEYITETCIPIIKLLVKYGINLNYLDYYGRNIHDYAIQYGWLDFPEIVKIMTDNNIVPTGKRKKSTNYDTKIICDEVSKSNLIASRNQLMQYLYNHRYDKSVEKQQIVFDYVKQNITTNDLKYKDLVGEKLADYIYNYWYIDNNYNGIVNNMSILLKSSNFIKLIENTENYECMVCMETSGELGMLSCEHKFHFNCIKTYLDNDNYKCPNCLSTIELLL
jgi:hypothetical protein